MDNLTDLGEIIFKDGIGHDGFALQGLSVGL